jgi:hypothetical protein
MRIFTFLLLVICSTAPTITRAAAFYLPVEADSVLPEKKSVALPYYLGAGAQYSPLRGGEAWGPGIVFSFGGVSGLNDNWSLLSEYQFKWLGGTKERYTYEHHYEYPLEYSVTYATYEVPQMFFLQIPYVLQYRPNGLKWLGLQMGLKVDYNWMLRGNRQPSFSSQQAGSVIIDEPSPFEGITVRDGLRRWGWGGIVGLHILLGKRAALDMRYNYAFNDLSRNAFYKDKQRVGDTGFQLVLQHLILSKTKKQESKR